MYLSKLLAGKRRNAKANRLLGYHLACVAGAVNTTGFLMVHQYTSHMTGVLSTMIDSALIGDVSIAWMMLVYLLCFILGAATTAMMVLWARKRNLHSRYAIPIFFEAGALLGCVFISHQSSFLPDVIALLCYVMGLQNALITKVSDTRIRTTHVTGMVTDIGIELGRIVYSFKCDKQTVWISIKQMWLHLAIIFMFICGGIAGGILFNFFGIYVLLPISFYLFFISSYAFALDATIYCYIRKRQKRIV